MLEVVLGAGEMNSGPLGIFESCFMPAYDFERSVVSAFLCMFRTCSLHIRCICLCTESPRATYEFLLCKFHHSNNLSSTWRATIPQPPKNHYRDPLNLVPPSFIQSFTIPVTPNPTPEKRLIIPQSKLRPVIRQLVITPISPPN